MPLAIKNEVLMDFDAIIVGAGPYGLSAAAYLQDRGFGVAVFGDPLSFWRCHMPAGMFLRSTLLASHISHPRHKFTIDHFKAETGKQFEGPVPLQCFVEYGLWFQRNAVPDVHRRQVTAVEKNGSGFHVTLDDGRFPQSDQAKIRWEGWDSSIVYALGRTPLDAALAESILSFSRRMGESMDTDHVATVVFAHWPGAARGPAGT